MTEQATGGTPGTGGTPTQATGNGSPGQPPPQNGATGGMPAGGTPGKADAGDDEVAGLRSALRSEREARKAAEDQARDFGGRLRALETKDLPEAERNARELAEYREREKAYEGRLRTLALREAATRHAATLGFANPALAYRLLDPTEVEWSKDGEPKDVDKLLSALLKSEPYLASAYARPQGDVGQGQRGQAAPANDMNAMLRRAAGR